MTIGKVRFYLLLLSLLFSCNLNASKIDFSLNNENILAESEIYVDKKNLPFSEIKTNIQFQKNNLSHINLGFTRHTTLWVKLEFENKSTHKVSKILEVQNPLLEEVSLYDKNRIIQSGSSHLPKPKHIINTTFNLSLNAYENRTIYLKVKNNTTALRFGISLKDRILFLEDEHHQQLLIYVFFTIVLMLFFYNGILFFYTKEHMYAYYCLYLTALIFQQSTYLGITQMFMPQWFVDYDNLNVLFKVNFMYITAALFAKSFLQTYNYPSINKVYNFFIGLSIIEVPIFGTPYFYYPEIGIFTALIFIFYNMYAGFYIYKKGYKQARLFVIGWSFLVIGFMLMILDGLGFISVMQNISNAIMFLIALEAIVLSLAFVDRYIILRMQKEESDILLVQEYESRQAIIEEKIQAQTVSLSDALETEQTLLRELQHRTKNNLQLILSLVRMQADGSDENIKEKLNDLVRRINAISKTHQNLITNNNLEYIDMQYYLSELYADILQSCSKSIDTQINVLDVYMPIREASYIGLVINELITNSIKYVDNKQIQIRVNMHKEEGIYFLSISDNSEILNVDALQTGGLGLKLVRTLVERQLDGLLKIEVNNGLKYTIEFQL